QKIGPIGRPKLYFHQPTIGGAANGAPCALNCTFIAHAFDEDNDGLEVQIVRNYLNNAKITVVDDVRPFRITSNTEQNDIPPELSGGVLALIYEGEVSPVGSFLIAVQRRRDICNMSL
ncbi:hypothetical protein PMAYCL1PPCAC_05621, partial [Pristionchus mayeri]